MLEFSFYPTVASLESALGKTSELLERLAVGCDSGSLYEQRNQWIRGKVRAIAVPDRDLDTVQERIANLLYPFDIAAPSIAHGYVRQRSTLTNARTHAPARFLQKFDIASFFGSITRDMVAQALCDVGFGQPAATMLSRILTCAGTLPLGSRSSPRVSNLVLGGLDIALEELATSSGIKFSRYADDMTFSANFEFDIAETVAGVVARAGFTLNEEKTKKFKRGQPMYVTGLSVEDDRPRVRSRLKRSLRTEFYFVEMYGLDEHAGRLRVAPRLVASRLMGQFHYVRAIEPNFAAHLEATYPTAFAALIPQRAARGPAEVKRRRDDFIELLRRHSRRRLGVYTPTTPLF